MTTLRIEPAFNSSTIMMTRKRKKASPIPWILKPTPCLKEPMPSPKFTYISTDICEYDNKATQEEEEEDVAMHTDHEEYQYHDTEMILNDHHDSIEDLCFMNRTKNETPTKSNKTNNNINTTNKEDGITTDTEDRSTEDTNETLMTFPSAKAKEHSFAKAKGHDTPSLRT